MDSDYYYYSNNKYSHSGMSIKLSATYKVLRYTTLKFKYTIYNYLKLFLIKVLTKFSLCGRICLEVEREINIIRVGIQMVKGGSL